MDFGDYEHLSFSRPVDGVLQVTLDRPDVMNATNARMHWELTQIWRTVEDDPATRAVVVTGAGDRAFSAGGDLDWIEQMVGNAELLAQVEREASQIVYGILDLSKPVVSAINGVAVGAGLAVALMADVSVMADSARLSDGHARLGVGAGDHAAIIWPLLCGMAKAKYYLMTADFIDGATAERIGLVTFCTPAADVLPRALKIATQLASGSQPAIRGTKDVLNGWLRQAGPIFDASVRMEMLGFMGADAREGVAALKERRAPQFPSARSDPEA